MPGGLQFFAFRTPEDLSAWLRWVLITIIQRSLNHSFISLANFRSTGSSLKTHGHCYGSPRNQVEHQAQAWQRTKTYKARPQSWAMSEEPSGCTSRVNSHRMCPCHQKISNIPIECHTIWLHSYIVTWWYIYIYTHPMISGENSIDIINLHTSLTWSVLVAKPQSDTTSTPATESIWYPWDKSSFLLIEYSIFTPPKISQWQSSYVILCGNYTHQRNPRNIHQIWMGTYLSYFIIISSDLSKVYMI